MKRKLICSMLATLILLNFSGCASEEQEQQEYYSFNDYVGINEDCEEDEDSTISTFAKYLLIYNILKPNNSYSGTSSNIIVPRKPKTNNRNNISSSKTKPKTTTKVKKPPSSTKPIKTPTNKVRTKIRRVK